MIFTGRPTRTPTSTSADREDRPSREACLRFSKTGSILLAVLLLSLPVDMTPCLAVEPTPTFAEGMALFRRHRFGEAAALFAEVEKGAPGQTNALLYRGKALVNLNRIQAAAAALEQYVALHPNSDDGFSLLAYIRFRQGRPADSLKLYTRAAALHTPVADDLKIVALDYALLDDYTSAAKYLEMALEIDPGNLEARYHLGRVRYQQNRFDEAIAAFEAVLRKDPGHVKAQDNLGLCLEGQGKLDQAVAAYRRAIDLDQQSRCRIEQPYLDLGSLLTKTGHADQAIRLLLQASRTAPQSPKAHYELGKTYLDLNQIAPSKEHLERAAQLEPKNSSVHYQLAQVYRRLGKVDLEKRELQLVEKLTPQQH